MEINSIGDGRHTLYEERKPISGLEFFMRAVLCEEAGYRSAIAGLALSYRTSTYKAMGRATSLFCKDGGHNKFMEQLELWIEVRAPRYWWQEADTYRLSSKQSESTMHTLVRDIKQLYRNGIRGLSVNGFGQVEAEEKTAAWFQENFASDTIVEFVEANFENGRMSVSEDQWARLVIACFEADKYARATPAVRRRIEAILAKQRIPESFLQTRMWKMSYKTMRNIVLQRSRHTLPHWEVFIKSVIEQSKHPEFFQPELTAFGDIHLRAGE